MKRSIEKTSENVDLRVPLSFVISKPFPLISEVH